ncbi:MAG: glucose-1-phosphate thymidylyltransferase [Lentimicrobiaceae bacterium]|jgi:UDP-N-acetylglucosamine diphosphorylase/glucosamine-1-phosphate N-acetyltransferase|nr:glucose-1-phosphate thymidylyltransferase [Lentimicrobiaceae bacterium]MCP4909526.1 glucose-1-phosphate thymidylyltransferase [Bacteroidota bacterium]MBT3454444.1 glucose-1-phosphate thymidylyltransferase [Lentimicrobiaceae bacterium]MBT3818054.1 glucose-1-phosphate thymidylyltransferase [Lentimicrobiaceae bacterium]MBT4061833.1 glucose-1-phosphate thymidylyltransferase [Lentimicrobiaceae bacterium]
MNYILFDGPNRDKLLPFTFTRPVCEIRAGILTIKEKWDFLLESKTSILTEEYLSTKFHLKLTSDNIFIDGSIIPTNELIDLITKLENNQCLSKGDHIIAYRSNTAEPINSEFTSFNRVETGLEYIFIENTWDIFRFNPHTIESDFKLLTSDKLSSKISNTNNIIGDTAQIFIEDGANVEYAYLNTTDGPIYIGKDSHVMEGSKIRGPFALCNNSTIKMDAKIYSGTTVGPYSKVGGEVSNSVIFGYSNKGHDGFLGNSVIGEWCNLGADTNTSNLKNTYDFVRLWSYDANTFVSTGLQFCGLIMGDHSKSGINTMFNTGTVVGVSSNIYGAGFQRNFIPSFMWGGVSGLKPFNFKKSVDVAIAVFKRRNKDFNDTEQNIFSHLYALSHK